MSRREYTEILEDQLTLSEPGGADYTHRFQGLPTALLPMGAVLKREPWLSS